MKFIVILTFRHEPSVCKEFDTYSEVVEYCDLMIDTAEYIDVYCHVFSMSN